MKTRQQLDAGVGVCWTANHQQHTDSSPSKDFAKQTSIEGFLCVFPFLVRDTHTEIIGWMTGQDNSSSSFLLPQMQRHKLAVSDTQLFIQHLKAPRASTTTDLWHSPTDVCFKIIYFSSLISLYIKIVKISLMASRRRPWGLQRPLVL